jgi:hypothetical protein
MKKKASQTSVEIIGVVHPSGAGGGQSRGEVKWRLAFVLQPWKRRHGDINESEIVIFQEGLSRRILDRRMESICPYRVLRLKVRMTRRKDVEHRLRAELLKLVGDDLDPDLQQRSKQLQQPVVVFDRFFGEFTLNRTLNWYETKKEWNGKIVEVNLSLDGCQDENAFIRLAEKLWKSQKKWERQVRRCAAKELLPIKNGNWRDEGEGLLSAKAFQDRMELQSILISPNGEIQFSFDDGDLFWGHSIEVSGSVSEGPKYANIEG